MNEQEVISPEPLSLEQAAEKAKEYLAAPKTDKEIIEDYIKDKDVQANLKNWAVTLQIAFRGNWFTAEKALKLSKKMKVQEMRTLLQLMVFSQKAVVKTQRQAIFYKIAIDPQVTIDHHKSQIAELNAQIRVHQDAIDKLSA